MIGTSKHCKEQSAECRRLMKSAQSDAEVKILKDISYSWARLAGQVDRYHALVRDRRVGQKSEGQLSWRPQGNTSRASTATPTTRNR